MENPELLKFVSDNLKNNKFVNIQLKSLSLVIRNVPDQYKTQQMCDKAILENGGTLESAPDCYKNQQMFDKAVDNYSHAL